MFTLTTNGKETSYNTPKALIAAIKALPENQPIKVTCESRCFIGTPKKALRNSRKAKKAGHDVPNMWVILLKEKV